MYNEMRKITLLKRRNNTYLLLLQFRGKLSYIESVNEINGSVDELKNKYVIKTYSYNSYAMLSNIYKTINFNNKTEVHTTTGILSEVIDDKVFIINKKKFGTYKIEDNILKVNVNINHIADPKYVFIDITKLYNHVLYETYEYLILLNKLEHKILDIY
jgi:hypothetical protein